ncbi:unnamed protein product [Sphagnum balticum]
MRVAIVANNWIATIVRTADCAKRTANRASVLLVHERQAWSAMKGLPRTTRPLGTRHRRQFNGVPPTQIDLKHNRAIHLLCTAVSVRRVTRRFGVGPAGSLAADCATQ